MEDNTKQKRAKLVQGIKNFFSSGEDKDDLSKKRQQLLTFLKEKKVWLIYVLLAFIIGFGLYIRTKNLWLLKDITNGAWVSTDLDSHIYLKYAKEILQNGFLSAVDMSRFVPLGAPTANYAFPAYCIYYLYQLMHFFNAAVTIEYADIIYPLVAFAIGVVFFFLLVKRLFNVKVALLSSLFLAIIPAYLQRTVTGSSDHDSLGMMFLFMAMYFFVVAWQSKGENKSFGSENNNHKGLWIPLGWGAAAGIATGLTGLSWGAWKFLALIFGLFVLIEFLFNKVEERQVYVYAVWLFFSVIMMTTFIPLFPLKSMITSITTALSVFLLLVLVVDLVIFKKDWLKIKSKFSSIKLPTSIVSLLISLLFGIIVLIIVLGPSHLLTQATEAKQLLLHPMGKDRWELTVAEQHQPYFSDIVAQFGSKLLTIPLFTTLFLLGAVLLFYNMVKENKRRILLTFLYLFFTLAIFMSRFSSTSTFNGQSTLSILVYLGSFVVIALLLGYYYLHSYYKDKETFHHITLWNSNYLFTLIWFLIMAIAARGAIRLIFVFAPIVTVLVAYVLIYLQELILGDHKKSVKILVYWLFFSFLWLFFMAYSIFNSFSIGNLLTVNPFLWKTFLFILLSVGLLFCVLSLNLINLNKKLSVYFSLLLVTLLILSPLGFPLEGIVPNFAQDSIKQATYSGTPYDQQWQIAGDWARKNLPENAIFGHWWDYGYWVQNGFERASVLDGANKVKYWNYLMGRHVLTGQSQNEALEFLYAHNTTHFLIVSDEIGKYTAYSSIGSDNNFDRYSWFTTYTLNTQATQETRNTTIFLYEGGQVLDEDFVWEGKVFPRGNSGIGGVFLPVQKVENREGNETVTSLSFQQPKIAMIYKNQRTDIPLECVYFNGQMMKFSEPGYKGCLRLIPTISDKGQLDNPLGAALLVSEKAMRALWVNLYVFDQNNPQYDTSAFKLAYKDSYLSELIYSPYRGLMGPIKIWEIEYPRGFTISEELRQQYIGGNELLPDYFFEVN